MEFDYILTVFMKNGTQDAVRSSIIGDNTLEEASKLVKQEIGDLFTKVMENGAIFTLEKHDEGVVISWNTKYVTRFATEIVERGLKEND